jgi:hypothetical protein
MNSYRYAKLLVVSWAWLVLSAVAAGASLAGCGPYINEHRLIAAPARPDDCELEFLHLQPMDMSPLGGAYEILGRPKLGRSFGLGHARLVGKP